jgi:hypothetical protein
MSILEPINSINELSFGDVLVNHVGEEFEVLAIVDVVVMLDDYHWYDVKRLRDSQLKLVITE